MKKSFIISSSPVFILSSFELLLLSYSKLPEGEVHQETILQHTSRLPIYTILCYYSHLYTYFFNLINTSYAFVFEKRALDDKKHPFGT
jgi:hypothetical protein